MKLCRRLLQQSAIFRMSLFILLFTSLSLASQSSAPQCVHLFLSEEVITERLKTLAQTKIKLDHRDYSSPDLLAITQKQFQEDLSQIVRLYPKSYEIFLNFLKAEDPSIVLKRVEKREEKEANIQALSLAQSLLKIEIDQTFEANILEFFEKMDPRYREKVSNIVLNEWNQNGQPMNLTDFSHYFFQLSIKIFERNDLALAKKILDLKLLGSDSFPFLNEVALNGLKDIFEFIFKTMNVDLNRKSSIGETPLHLAARVGSIDVLRFLLSQPSIDVNTKDNFVKTALNVAGDNLKKEAFELILKHPSFISYEGNKVYAASALSFAAKNAWKDSFDYILKNQRGLDINKEEQGMTALNWAIHRGWKESVEIILNFPDVNLFSRDQFGRSPLLIAVSSGSKDIFDLIMKHPNVYPDKQAMELAQAKGWL